LFLFLFLNRQKELRESDKSLIVDAYLASLKPFAQLNAAELADRLRVVCDALGAHKWALVCVRRLHCDEQHEITPLTLLCGKLVSLYGAEEAGEIVRYCEAYRL
jgi:hypothetical protein